ncbi:VWA domain-containing protein [Massilia sp. CCM 8734]|uniref:VWA domain-containing protein n=1 Tax=Massilia sp. CCM 8734 TaxID=2609283 RepID=UPI00141D7828|nr:VWA domain-containing protein [Massilia sp. CCM 8734]NHZ99901.1 VWA domain-containing protein [Massilia sp. CCM 8734]
MENLSRGQRLPLAGIAPDGRIDIGLSAAGLRLDFACFGLGADGKLLDESYMTFFNQPRTPCGGARLTSIPGDLTGFSIDTGLLPANIDQLAITASVDGDGTMAQLSGGYLRLLAGSEEKARFAFSGNDFAQERAIMLGNLYRKDGQWRFMAVGQGFNGGLDALVAHFGGAVAAPAPVATPAPARISLEKRIASTAPHLVSLVKHATVSLEKAGLADHRAKVALVLDISGSMGALYRKGLVQQFADRILALGCKFDDDGEIDVFLFGKHVHQPAPMSLANARTYIRDVVQAHPLEADTCYGKAMEAVRRFYFPDANGGERKSPLSAPVPVFVMFVTDGSTSDKALTEKQLRWASQEPIFWQFMGIGKGKKSKSKKLAAFAHSDFPFLEQLDDLSGRLIDNADFFSVESPDEHSDSGLYDLLMAEYPGWIKMAKQHRLLA